MNDCAAVREILMDAARGAPADRSLREHLAGCPECRLRVANQRMLSAGLAAVASPAVPPTSIKDTLMAEFRRSHRVTPIRRPFVKWAAMAVAAAILAAVFVGARHHPEKIVTSVAPRVEAPLPVRVAPAATAKQRKPAKRRRVARIQPPPVEQAPEVATDFFEIPYAEPLRPEERADVFRIEIPRANMAVFGLPVAGGRLDSSVTADVLIGEDGVMRAIRFIR